MLARMPTSRAELLAKQNKAIAKLKVPPKKITHSEWIAYQIDQYISTRRGQIATLSLLGGLLIIIGAIFLKAVQVTKAFAETVWESWTYLADPGAHTGLTIDVSSIDKGVTEAITTYHLYLVQGVRVIGVLTTLVGILYFSVIMGFVVDGIRDKMDMLKKGKSNVAEEKHTVSKRKRMFCYYWLAYTFLSLLQLLLGWSDKSISLIRQICLANASENGGVIVVLAEIDKEELEAELESQMRKEELRGTRVIFRTGTPLLSVDLLKVSAHRARSIIIMANSTGDADRSDAAILRTVLSLKTLPEVPYLITFRVSITLSRLTNLLVFDNLAVVIRSHCR